ncbi:MAG: protein of unknown function with transrane region [Parcubacteria group bacterium]|nr:protein of unknown function with transrane region [Parcubacteria group bacterium]
MEPLDQSRKDSASSDNFVPKKYIRTFAGDMETVQKGGIPDLKPLVPLEPEVPVEGKVVPVRAPAEHVSNEVAQVRTPSERLVGATSFEETEVSLSPPEVMEGLLESALLTESVVVAPLKTYAGDFSDRIKSTNASTATMLAAEQDARTDAPQAAPPKTTSTILYIVGGVVLLFFAIGGGALAYFHYQKLQAPVVIAPVAGAPIVVEERAEVRGEGAVLLQGIEQSITDQLAAGSVRLLYTMSTTTKSIFGSLTVGAPDILVRNVLKEGSMVGVIHLGSTQSPFFILSVLSYPETFAGMLSWEKSITRDLTALFPAYAVPVVAAAPIATSTATTSKSLTPKKVVPSKATSTISPMPAVPVYIPGFRDEVVSNHDVRIYRDSAGRSVLVYGYWNQNTLLIARDLIIYAELLNRLGTVHSSTP